MVFIVHLFIVTFLENFNNLINKFELIQLLHKIINFLTLSLMVHGLFMNFREDFIYTYFKEIMNYDYIILNSWDK